MTLKKDAASEKTESSNALEPGDFYMEGPYIVFTSAYHLRRGYCCNSDCRHCPYKTSKDGESSDQTQDAIKLKSAL